jgi:membrane-associated phospholipid phosphatase
LVDEALHRADLTLGLDWWAYVSLVKGNRWIGDTLALAYQSSLLQIATAVVILGLMGRKERLERMTFAFMLCILVAIAIWTLFPSFGALPLRYAEGYPPPPFHLVMNERYARSLVDLRAGAVSLLTPSNVDGLIGCPSVHAAWAALMIYSFWGVRWLGPVALAANVLVLISIPADGGHHFIDVFAGLSLACGALLLARLPTSLRVDPRADPAYAAVKAGVGARAAPR